MYKEWMATDGNPNSAGVHRRHQLQTWPKISLEPIENSFRVCEVSEEIYWSPEGS